MAEGPPKGVEVLLVLSLFVHIEFDSLLVSISLLVCVGTMIYETVTFLLDYSMEVSCLKQRAEQAQPQLQGCKTWQARTFAVVELAPSMTLKA